MPCEAEDADEIVETVEVNDASIDLDQYASVLYNMTESMLTKVLIELEKALPAKKKIYAGSKKAAGTSLGGRGVTRLSKVGKAAALMLKRALPKVCACTRVRAHRRARAAHAPPHRRARAVAHAPPPTRWAHGT